MPIAVTPPEVASPQIVPTKKPLQQYDVEITPPLTRRNSTQNNPIEAHIKLNDGNTIPQVALGVYKAPDSSETEDAVIAALNSGYRHIDSAARYANEGAVGRAINRWLADNKAQRKDIFVTSKLWDADHGYESTMKALDDSLQKIGLDYLDLYLIHSPSDCDKKRMESWSALEDAKKAGKVKSIGVSNFGTSHINHLLANTKTIPAVNQVEIHPFCPRTALVQLCKSHGIVIQSYSPLARGNKLEDERIIAIAEKHGRTAAQVLLNWNAGMGNVVLPKSLTPERIESNAKIFDFRLDDEDLKILNSLGEEEYVTGSLHKSD